MGLGSGVEPWDMPPEPPADGVRCSEWIGLEVPEFADCSLILGHAGQHKGILRGVTNGKDGQPVDAVIFWPELKVGAEPPGSRFSRRLTNHEMDQIRSIMKRDGSQAGFNALWGRNPS